MTVLATARRERTLLLEVRQRSVAADGVVLLTLADPAGQDLPGWVPGAHVDLVLPDLGLTRQYSLCGDPADRSGWRLGVLRQPNGRGGSQYVHDVLQVGARVEVRGPRNNFPLLPARRYLFIAGGIGITPILPMIAAAAADGREWELLYGGRGRSSMAFLEDLAVHGDRVRGASTGRGGAAAPGVRPGDPATGLPGLLLRARAVDRGGRGPVLRLARPAHCTRSGSRPVPSRLAAASSRWCAAVLGAR